MLCDSSSTPENGLIKCLEWSQSLVLHRYIGIEYQKNKRLLLHKTKQEIRSFCALVTQQYKDNQKIIPSQPNIVSPGCLSVFNNNVIHRGGYGRVVGRTRIVSIMQIYTCLFASELEKKLTHNPPNHSLSATFQLATKYTFLVYCPIYCIHCMV
jgi:hypothetical protein